MKLNWRVEIASLVLIAIGLAVTALVMTACDRSGGRWPGDSAVGDASRSTGDVSRSAGGASTAEAVADPTDGPESFALYVGPSWVDCSELADRRCLQVKTAADAEYETFAGEIAGFAYEEGYAYELRVARAPGTETGWTLLAQVRKDAAPRAAEAAGIESTTWRLVSYADSSGAMERPPEGSVATLRLEGGQLSGSGGCNSFSGTYVLEGIGLSLAVDAVTQAVCDEASMAVEAANLGRLPEVTSWLVVGPQLQLVDARGKALLIYRAEGP